MALTRVRRKEILTLALPIIGGMVSQNVLNLVDTAMVGQLGKEALAGVGVAGFAFFVTIAFITGLSAGVQAMVARRHGEGEHHRKAVPLNGGLLLALGLGAIFGTILFLTAPAAFQQLNDDPAVAHIGGEYLRIRSIAVIAVGMNYAFRGYWNGVSQTAVYFRTIVVMHVVNITLNWLLIFGNLGMPEMGANGAALGTALSTWVGTVLYFAQGSVMIRSNGFLAGIPDRETMTTMLRLAVPAGLQQFFFAAGMLVLFWIIGQLGTEATAASTVIVNILLTAVLPGIAFGLASGALVGQALGRGDPEGAKIWGWDVAKFAAICIGIVSLPPIIFPDIALYPFLWKEPETLAIARWPLRIVMMGMFIDTYGSVLMNSLLGAGDARPVMAIAVTMQWCLFLPAAYLLGPVFQRSLLFIWMGQSVYRTIQTGLFAWLWQRGRWAEIKV